VGAKVNGKMVPLRHPLKNGDTVEILTNPNHVPNKDWLKFVKSPRAKAKIKHVINLEEGRRSLEIGKKLLEKEAGRFRVAMTQIHKAEALGDLFQEYAVNDLDELLAGIGYGKISARNVLRKLFPEKTQKEEGEAEAAKPAKRRAGAGGLKIKGADDLLIHFSRCCNPLPGDRIVGYITRGRGISIHTTQCPNLDELDYDKERMVEVDWDVKEAAIHPVKIMVLTVDRPGVLASVSSTITSADTNISHADITTTEDRKAVLKFVVDIKDLSHLERLLQKIEQVDGVLSAKRLMGS